MRKTIEEAPALEVLSDSFSGKAMKTRHFFGDAMTVVSANIIFNIANLTTYFYTDVIGLAASTVGTVLLMSKLADAFTDVGMGTIVDRTKSKYGKARPWLIRMAFPALLCIFLLFAIPSGTGAGFKIIYIGATNILLLAVVYTAIAVPSGSLLSLETSNPTERSKMGIWRLVFAYAAGMSVTGLMVPTANRLGGDQRAWIVMGVVFGVISAGSLVISFFCICENNNVKPRGGEDKIPLAKGITLLFRNKYWGIALVVNILIQVIYATRVAQTYYMKYILGNENLVAAASLYALAFIIIGFFLSGLLIRRLGKRNLILAGMVVSVFGCILRIIAPYHLTLNLVAIGIANLGSVPVLAVIGAMVADTIEYGEWKTGVRTVGLASSAHSFAGKLGSAIFVGMAGWLLGLSGYDGMLPVQPPMAVKTIMILNIHVPLICYGAIFVFMLFYGLDKDYGRIIADLDARRKNA